MGHSGRNTKYVRPAQEHATNQLVVIHIVNVIYLVHLNTSLI